MATMMAAKVLALVAACLVPATVTGQHIEVSSPRQVVLPGSNVTFVCRASEKIQSCRVLVPSLQATYPFPGTMINGISYYGKGFESGECGFTIHEVRNEYNGIVTCGAVIHGTEKSANMTLTVARAPERPRFELSTRKNFFYEGEILEIRCVIENGRPVADIEWYLDNEKVSNQKTHSLSIKDGREPGLETRYENFTITLTPNDNGRELMCKAKHMSIPPEKPLYDKMIFNVRFAPKTREDPINIFGIKLGEVGKINVTVQANPKPTSFEWSFDGNPIVSDYSETYQREIIDLGRGFYNVSLMIASVTREHINNDFRLRVRNEIGTNEYRIRISTMDEPQGVDLGIGSIIGIIISILIILIVIILIIFAKATNRWCFNGGALKTDIPDAGDSEAPLPSEKGESNISVGAVNPSHEDYIPNGNGKAPDIKSMDKPDTAV